MNSADGPLRVESLCETGRGGVAARQAGVPTTTRQVHRAVLRAFLATGQAPHRDDLGLPEGGDLVEAFRRLDEVDLVHLDGGRIAVAYPFSGVATGHVMRLDGAAPVHAMCAIDALGIPLMTGRDGVIESADPDDGRPIRVERRGGTWRWSPEQTVILLAQTRHCGPAADCLCPTITFHSKRERAKAYLRSRPELTGLVLDQAQAVQIADWSFGPLLAGEPGLDVSPVTGGSHVIVEMLHTEGCPHAEEYLPRLRRLVAEVGVCDPVRVRTVADAEQAQRERFLGSPTVRVNGRDVDPGADARRDYALSCRLYRGPNGVSGIPPDDWVLALLRADGSDS